MSHTEFNIRKKRMHDGTFVYRINKPEQESESTSYTHIYQPNKIFRYWLDKLMSHK